MTTPIQDSPYLREQRSFPNDNAQVLTVEVDRAYVDIAQKMNVRTIGLFAVGNVAITGESWFLTGTGQQTLRQLYTFTSAGSIPHGIVFSQIAGIVKIYGTFTNGTNWYPLPYVDIVSATNQVNIVVNPTNIVISSGGGAPAIVSGFVVLEWLSNI